jgi:hypothetical protein
MIPPGIGFVDKEPKLFWLLKDVGEKIDLRWMSAAANRRDFPEDTRGSHMAEDEDTCFLEVKVRRDWPLRRTYLLCFTGKLRSADYRSMPSELFSGQMYGTGHDFSRFIFVENSGEFVGSGANSILRYSAAAYQVDDSLKHVFGLFPQALPQLELEWVEPIGVDSPPIPIVFFDGHKAMSSAFPRPPPSPNFAFGP